MKRIIDGKTYNTETATPIASAQVDSEYYDEHLDQTLYVTRGGAFFLDTLDKDDDTHFFEPMSREAAEKWVMEGQVEIINDFFPEPPEAAAEEPSRPEATIYLRVPTVLKEQIDASAKNADQSTNAWAMRCLESCLTAQRGEQALVEALEAERPPE